MVGSAKLTKIDDVGAWREKQKLGSPVILREKMKMIGRRF
jgi:hypothetical protein